MAGEVHGEERGGDLGLRDEVLEERPAARLRDAPERHAEQPVVRQSVHLARARAHGAERLVRDGQPGEGDDVRHQLARYVPRTLLQRKKKNWAQLPHTKSQQKGVVRT